MAEYEYGRMFWMKNSDLGETLYMKVNPPITCEHCDKRISDWELNEYGVLECPKCQEVIKEFNKVKCSCGEEDMIAVVVAANNNFGIWNDGTLDPRDSMVNRVFTVCKKSFDKDIENQTITPLSKVETVMRKRMLVWTAQMTYEPGKPVPQWIKDMFPLPGE